MQKFKFVGWNLSKIVFAIIVTLVAFETIRISVFSLNILGFAALYKWNWWANSVLGAVLAFGAGVCAGSAWISIKKMVQGKEGI